MDLSIAQNNIVWENFDKNLDLILHNIRASAEQGSDLVIFPEMTLSGFSMDINNISLPPLNRYFDKICALAAKLGISVVFGACVKEKNKYYNRLFVINTCGELQQTYDKIHPFSFSNEHKYFTPGNAINTFEFNGSQLCGYICYDLRFPEIFTAVADEVDLFIVIANWPQQRMTHWKTLLRARALGSLSYVVGVNRIGSDPNEKYNGQSMVFSPWGKLLHNAEEEILSRVEIDLSQVEKIRSQFSLLKDRRDINQITDHNN